MNDDQFDHGADLDIQNKIQIHIWIVDKVRQWSPREEHVLSPREIARADRFQFPQHRERFVSGHCWLRHILGEFIGCPAAQIQFGENEFGKPFVVEPKGTVEFNYSHSQDSCICVATQSRKIGVDIELKRQLDDMASTAATIFDPEDLDSWKKISPNIREDVFFQCWSRKEAVLKAAGVGLSNGVKQLHVPIAECLNKECHKVVLGNEAFICTDLEIDSRFTTSVAVEQRFAEECTEVEISDEIRQAGSTETNRKTRYICRNIQLLR